MGRRAPAANAPDVRLAMVERTAGLMRRCTAGGGERFVVAKDERWLRLSADQAFILDMGGGTLFDPATFISTHLVPIG